MKKILIFLSLIFFGLLIYACNIDPLIGDWCTGDTSGKGGSQKGFCLTFFSDGSCDRSTPTRVGLSPATYKLSKQKTWLDINDDGILDETVVNIISIGSDSFQYRIVNDCLEFDGVSYCKVNEFFWDRGFKGDLRRLLYYSRIGRVLL